MATYFFIGLAVGVIGVLPIIVIATRRTARRVERLSQRAQAAERLADQAMMTGGLAHEIKNPLSSIGLNAQLIREDLTDIAADLAPDDAMRQRIGRIERRFDALTHETNRLRDILEDFLRFAGRLQLDRQSVDVNDMVSELADFFAPQAQAANVRVRTQLNADPPTASIDADHLKQALLNLMLNACQVMESSRGQDEANGGNDELMLRTDRRRPGGADELLIQVIDTGPGMDADKASQVFQPYFSTRKGGTGLGLPTARRIAEAHGGTLTLHAEPGRGCVFTFAIPVQAVDAPASEGA